MWKFNTILVESPPYLHNVNDNKDLLPSAGQISHRREPKYGFVLLKAAGRQGYHVSFVRYPTMRLLQVTKDAMCVPWMGEMEFREVKILNSY
jgi:hypothetical protein